MRKNSRYPLKHLSARAPWHDNGWNGTICNNAKDNSACLILKNCALERDDEKEQSLCGQKIKNLNQADFPPCLRESGAVMASFDFNKSVNHPYAKTSPETHGHFKPTNLRFPSFSASSIPYFWMRKENAVELANRYDLDYDETREPELDWQSDKKTGWIQEYANQKALLNCFYEHLEPETSLIFLYAKQVPFVESSGSRILIGVGRVKHIVPSEKYEGSNKKLSAAFWEHLVHHSIRDDMADGFLLPYHDALAFQKEHPSFDPAELAVIAPNDKKFEFSYAAEHISNDTAIRVLLDCQKTWEKAQELGIGRHHEKAIQWIHNELQRVQKMRGHYPGMGAALCAFGVPKGHFVAADIINNLKDEKQNPWKVFERAVNYPGVLKPEIAALIPENSKRLYKRLKEKNSPRLDLLHLISRFDLSIEQAIRMYVEEEREKLKTRVNDKRLLENPYLIYELNIYQLDSIALDTIDLGLYLKNPPDDLLPENAVYDDPFDSNRVRALTFRQLQLAAAAGHTLLPRAELIKQIRSLSIEPKCDINRDYYELAEEVFNGVIEQAEMKNGDAAYQLSELASCGKIIREKVNDRIGAKLLEVEDKWEKLLTERLKKADSTASTDEREQKARTEKIAALKEIASSRFSVLIGPAGTGKTTLLTVLASHPEIAGKGVLLLVPTGKARVRMEEIAKDINVTAKTLAQYLRNYDRYDGSLQRYKFSNQTDSGFETVILDEASMLTEEMLATTMDCLRFAKRFILVGDHRQLPPIGAGRPFFDIIHRLKPENVENEFPKMGRGYAELSIKMRQGGSKREDIQLAEWFSGEPLEPGADQIINDILANKESKYLKIVNWENEADFERKFENVLVEELKLGNINNIEQFNITLGAIGGKFFNDSSYANYKNNQPTVESIENWQILSPIKEKVFGVRVLNRKIHRLFRANTVKYAIFDENKKYETKVIPKPLGSEQIVYGDKVINLSNHPHKKVVSRKCPRILS